MKMKKSLIVLSIFSAICLSQVVKAEPIIPETCDCKFEGVKIVYTVVDSIHIEKDGIIMANTKRDSDGGFWTIEIIPYLNETKESAIQRYKEKEIAIGYVGDLQNDDSIDIVWNMPTSND